MSLAICPAHQHQDPVACGSCVRVLYRVLTIQRMSLRSASGALDEMAKHDPRRALREAERRRARRERNAIDERNLALGTPTQRSSAHRPSSAPFDSSTGRFDDPLTRHLREQIAPGAYEQSHATVATLGACFSVRTRDFRCACACDAADSGSTLWFESLS